MREFLPRKLGKFPGYYQVRKAGEAASLLKYIPRKAAKLLGKTLQSAMANAENNNNLNADDLYISEAIVEEGPALKRFRPCAVAPPIHTKAHEPFTYNP